MTFLPSWGVTEILYCFRLVLDGKTDKEISGSPRLEFLEEFSANNFADAVENTSGSQGKPSVRIASLIKIYSPY